MWSGYQHLQVSTSLLSYQHLPVQSFSTKGFTFPSSFPCYFLRWWHEPVLRESPIPKVSYVVLNIQKNNLSKGKWLAPKTNQHQLWVLSFFSISHSVGHQCKKKCFAKKIIHLEQKAGLYLYMIKMFDTWAERMHDSKLTAGFFHTIGHLFCLKMRNTYCLYQKNEMFPILSHLKTLFLLFQEFSVSMKY